MSTIDKLAEALRVLLDLREYGPVSDSADAWYDARAALATYEAEAKPADTEFIDGDCVIAWATEPKRASPAAPAAPADARKAFEVWASDQGYPLEIIEGMGGIAYQDVRTEGAWWAFQAGRAAPAAPAYITRDTIINGVRVVKVWPEGADEPQILGTTMGGAPAAPAAAIAGALFDFLGFLTTSERRWTFSSTDDAGPAVAALEQWAAKRSLSLDDADVEGWSAAPAAPATVPLSFEKVIELAAVELPSKYWRAFERLVREVERAHGIGKGGAPAAPAPLTDEQAAAIVGNVANLGDGLRIVRATEAAIEASKKGGAA